MIPEGPISVRICSDADATHRESLRGYAHTFCRPAPTICISSAFHDLPDGHRDGILAHEIGHLLAGPASGEEEADRAFESETGIRVQYRDGEHGRALQWLPADDRRRFAGMFEFRFEGTPKVIDEPDGDDVRFFARDDEDRVELPTLRAAELVAVALPDVDVWAQDGRRRLGWRPMARNPGEPPRVESLSTFCAWCGRHISGPLTPPPGTRRSGGMCDACRERELAEAGLVTTQPNPDETSLVPVDPVTHLPSLPSERLPAHEWRPPRVSWELMVSGRGPFVHLPEGASELTRVTRALGRLLTREGIADVNRWEDLHAACGLSARLFVVDRSGERWEVTGVGFDHGAETGWLELRHLGSRGAIKVGVHEGFGRMLPVVVYKPSGRTRTTPRPRSEAELIRDEIDALWRDHDKCSIRHGQFEMERIRNQIKELETRLRAIGEQTRANHPIRFIKDGPYFFLGDVRKRNKAAAQFYETTNLWLEEANNKMRFWSGDAKKGRAAAVRAANTAVARLMRSPHFKGSPVRHGPIGPQGQMPNPGSFHGLVIARVDDGFAVALVDESLLGMTTDEFWNPSFSSLGYAVVSPSGSILRSIAREGLEDSLLHAALIVASANVGLLSTASAEGERIVETIALRDGMDVEDVVDHLMRSGESWLERDHA